MSDELESVISLNRQKWITDQLRLKGSVTVSELSISLGVSPITIRRDLDKLDEKGILSRTHGGAMVNRNIQSEHPFSEKHAMQIKEKEAIGKVASELIKDGDTLFINSGSTVLEVLKNLKNKHVRVVTNNTVATAIPLDPKVELILVGGEYREVSHSLVGEFAKIVLSQIYSSITILGVNGVDVDHGLTTSVYHETSINKSMIERSRGPVIVVADSTKVGVVSNFVTAPATSATTLVVDDAITEEMKQRFTNIGLEVITAHLI
jgi:DeoR/GlpR family transcriptional regulator of sugar metabolism